VELRSVMHGATKEAVPNRLQFAVAELEVVIGIADSEGEFALLEEVRTLAERVQECIDAVSQGDWAQPSG